MNKIGIIVAMQKELELYLQDINNYNTNIINNHKYYRFTKNNCDVVMSVSGMGKVCSAVTTVNMINNFNPDVIINIGVAGGIDNSLNIGDFVLADKVCYHDVWCGEPNTKGQVQDMPEFYTPLPVKLSEHFSNMKIGLICSGDQFITASEKLNQIKTDFPKALAVDMESCSIAQTCHILQKPFIIARQISDTPHKADNEKQYKEFWEKAPKNSADILQKILEELLKM